MGKEEEKKFNEPNFENLIKNEKAIKEKIKNYIDFNAKSRQISDKTLNMRFNI